MFRLFKKLIYNPESKNSLAVDIGLLIMRLGFAGFMLFGHGLGKLMGYSTMSANFPDPLGIGGSASMAMVISAEFFASLAVIFGFLTRLTLIPLIVTMAVAGFIFHAADPFAKKELAFMFLIPFVGMFITGPGRFSFDAVIARIMQLKFNTEDKSESVDVVSSHAGLETSS